MVMKRRLSLVLAIVMALGMLLSFAGCAPAKFRGTFETETFGDMTVGVSTVEVKGVEYEIENTDKFTVLEGARPIYQFSFTMEIDGQLYKIHMINPGGNAVEEISIRCNDKLIEYIYYSKN